MSKQAGFSKAGARTRVGRSRAGLGLFATAEIPRDSFIIEYTGERLPTPEALERERRDGARYIMMLDARWSIDGAARENRARYVNHACKPNAEALLSGGRVRIVARRRIRAGEEITMDYGRAYFDLFIREGGCRCAGCVRAG